MKVNEASITESNIQLWEPLLRANATLDEINAILDEMNANRDELEAAIDKHFGDLEPVFSDLALKHLKEKNPSNIYSNLCEEITGKWKHPRFGFEFKLDGLIYDEKHNVLYMIESKFHLNEAELEKACETWEKLKSFLRSDKLMSQEYEALSFNRFWKTFFGEDGMIKNRDQTDVQAFLGFRSSEPSVIESAKNKGFQLIGPGKSTYEVYACC